MAMPQRPVGLDMKLSQPNVGLIYPLNYDKTCLLMSTVSWRDEMIEGEMIEGDKGVKW